MLIQKKLTVKTQGRGIINITADVNQIVNESKIKIGLCHVFLHHTSASLILCENYDPLVQSDLEAFMQRLVPDGDPMFQHIEEGPDDMPSHVRAILTSNFLQIPITDNQLALGTWQGVCIWEHRLKSHQRHLTITLQD